MPARHLCETRFRRTQSSPVASLLAGKRLCEPGPLRGSQCGNALPFPFHFQAAVPRPSTSTKKGIESEDSYLLRSGAQDTGDQRCHAVPLFSFGMELAPPGGGQTVELRLAFVVRLAPLTGDPTLMFQAIERWV